MFKKRRVQSDFSQELPAHLDLEADRLRAEGLGAPDAYRAARRNLGNLAGAGERFYESSRWLWLEHLTLDTRHALRRLRKAPVFSAAAIFTLALGMARPPPFLRSYMPFCSGRWPSRTPASYSAWAGRRIAACGADTRSPADSPSSPMNCTRIFATTRMASRN
jgi:hypothetical protein